MAKEKRTLVKLIRDGVKSNYKYAPECAICGASENLELHHYNTIFFLLQEFLQEHKEPTTPEEQSEFRELFINQYYKELVEETVTLCEGHHTKLHRIYGSKPFLHTASKQRSWISKQHDKIFNPESVKSSGLNRFKV